MWTSLPTTSASLLFRDVAWGTCHSHADDISNPNGPWPMFHFTVSDLSETQPNQTKPNKQIYTCFFFFSYMRERERDKHREYNDSYLGTHLFRLEYPKLPLLIGIEWVWVFLWNGYEIWMHLICYVIRTSLVRHPLIYESKDTTLH